MTTQDIIADKPTPITLRSLTNEIVDLDIMLDQMYEQTEPPKDASPKVKAQFLADRAAVEDALFEYLQANESAAKTKVDGYCSLIGEIEMLAAMRAAESKRLADLATVGKNKVKNLKAALGRYFDAAKLTKLECPIHTVSYVGNGGLAPLILTPEAIEHPELLPKAYQHVEITPDNGAIREALAAGALLPFAQIGERGKNVRIK